MRTTHIATLVLVSAGLASTSYAAPPADAPIVDAIAAPASARPRVPAFGSPLRFSRLPSRLLAARPVGRPPGLLGCSRPPNALRSATTRHEGRSRRLGTDFGTQARAAPTPAPTATRVGPPSAVALASARPLAAPTPAPTATLGGRPFAAALASARPLAAPTLAPTATLGDWHSAVAPASARPLAAPTPAPFAAALASARPLTAPTPATPLAFASALGTAPALATALVSAPPSSDVPVVDVLGPAPVFATLVLPPTGLERLSSTFLLRAINDALAPDVDVLPLEGGAYDACAEATTPRILCIVRAALPEQERGRGGRFLAIVSVRVTEVAGRDEEVAALLVVDLDRARALLERAPDADPSSADREVRRDAVVVRAPATLLGDAKEAKAFIAKQLGPIADRIRAEDPRDGDGALGVTTSTAGVDLFIDDRRVATVGAHRAVELKRVPVGSRRITARGPHIEPYEEEITLLAGRRRTLELELELSRPPIYGPYYSAMKWGGLALAASGVGLIAYENSRERNAIFFAQEPAAFTPLTVASLAAITAGLTWSVAAFLFEDPRRSPWLDLIVGVAAGATVGIASSLLTRPVGPP